MAHREVNEIGYMAMGSGYGLISFLVYESESNHPISYGNLCSMNVYFTAAEIQ